MRQSLRRGSSGRVWALVAGAAVAALVLAGPGTDAKAQTFNDAIQGALDNNCPSLGGAGGTQGTLFTICGGNGSLGSGAGTSSGASIASQALGQQGADQRRIQRRLEEQRQASREGGVLAASADPTFQLEKLGLFITGEGDWVKKDVTRFEPGFTADAG